MPQRRDNKLLSARQRRFAELYVQDVERHVALAAWRAGYRGGAEDTEPPEEKLRDLTKQGSKCLNEPKIAKFIQELEERAAAAYIASPQGAAVREHIAQVEEGLMDVERLGGNNLDVIVAIAHHDPRSVVSWGRESIEVRSSDELAYHEAILIKEVRHEDVFHKDGSQSHITTVKLSDRAPYIKMLEARLGRTAPLRVVHSGPGGGAIEVDHDRRGGPSAEVLAEFAYGVLGVVPGSESSVDGGLTRAEIRQVLRGWEADGATHCTEVEELFSDERWPETRARYLLAEG